MEVTTADFRQHFELLSDEALLETDRDDLVEMAKLCFDAEIARRGLDVADDSPGTAPASDGQASPGEEMVLLGTFTSGDEINLIRGLLESASIPSRVVNPLASIGGIEFRVMVPAAFEEHALEILATEISDEELAAQAEAAGALEEEVEEAAAEETWDEEAGAQSNGRPD